MPTKKSKPSRFAKRLRELGMKPLVEFDPEAASGESTDPWDQATDMLRRQQESVLAGLNRAQRREAEAVRRKKFICFGGFTQAWDEHLQEWCANTDVDLKPLGFEDLSAEMAQFMRPPGVRMH